MINIKIRLIILFAAKEGETIHSAKTRLGADCGSDHELLIAKFRLKLKKLGKALACSLDLFYKVTNPIHDNVSLMT